MHNPNRDELLCYYCKEFPVNPDLVTFCDEECKKKWQDEFAPKTQQEKRKARFEKLLMKPEERAKLKEKIKEREQNKMYEYFSTPISEDFK